MRGASTQVPVWQVREGGAPPSLYSREQSPPLDLLKADRQRASADVPRRKRPMRTPTFDQIDSDLWQWNEWFIAYACGSFWLLTAAAREFGPFQHFDQAYCQTVYLA